MKETAETQCGLLEPFKPEYQYVYSPHGSLSTYKEKLHADHYWKLKGSTFYKVFC